MRLFKAPAYHSDPEALLRATAFHEAAHAVVGYMNGKFIRDDGIRIHLDRVGTGHTALRASFIFHKDSTRPNFAKRNFKIYRNECVELLAGYAAESKAMGVRGVPLYESDDLNRVLENVLTYHGDVGKVALFEVKFYLMPATKRLINKPDVWHSISLVAQTLLKSGGYISYAESDKLFKLLPVKPKH